MDQKLHERISEEVLARARANQMSSAQCAQSLIPLTDTGKIYWKFLNRKNKDQKFDDWMTKQDDAE